MMEPQTTTSVQSSGVKCARCKKALVLYRTSKKYCNECKKIIQDQRSRDFHYDRRKARAENAMCIDCGVKKDAYNNEDLKSIIANADINTTKEPSPETLKVLKIAGPFDQVIRQMMLNKITVEMAGKSKFCRKCFVVYRARLFEIQLSKPPRAQKPLTQKELTALWTIYSKKNKVNFDFVANKPHEDGKCDVCKAESGEKLLCPNCRVLHKREKMKNLCDNRRERMLKENPKLCHHCLTREQSEGKTWCSVCLERGLRINKERIDERRKNKVCIVCGSDSNKKSLCEQCKISQRTNSKKWWNVVRAEREKSGLCLRCGKHPVEEGKKACVVCAAKTNKNLDERRASGICVKCGKAKSVKNRTMCPPCQEKCRAHMRNARDAREALKKSPVPLKQKEKTVQ